MTARESRLVQWTKKKGADLGQLDILVEDIKCQQANRINNRGLLAQVRYLLRYLTSVQFKKSVRHELAQLQKHSMVKQSKFPGKNVKLKRRK